MREKKTVNKCVRFPKWLWRLYSSVLENEGVEPSTDMRRMVMLRILVSKVEPQIKFSILNKIREDIKKGVELPNG